MFSSLAPSSHPWIHQLLRAALGNIGPELEAISFDHDVDGLTVRFEVTTGSDGALEEIEDIVFELEAQLETPTVVRCEVVSTGAGAGRLQHLVMARWSGR